MDFPLGIWYNKFVGDIMRAKIINEEVYLPEPVGKQPKYWICAYDKRYLFKVGTVKQDGSPIYNDVSECMAADIAELIGIPVAQYYLCENDGVKGVLSYDFLDNKLKGPKKEEFIDGVTLINIIDPGFKNTSLVNPKTHQLYTADLIIQSVLKYNLMEDVINMFVYDSLIGNRDRNPSNYGIIINHETDQIRFAPLYDNCTALGVSMVDHRLHECVDENGNIIDEQQLDLVIHKHIVGKVTLDRFHQYKEKRAWDKIESKRIMDLIDEKKKELLVLVEDGKLSVSEYHKILNKIGDTYRKYDVSTLEYQQMISYLTMFYSEYIEQIIDKIEKNITRENIDKLFDYYQDELPPDRLRFAKELVLRRANWIVEYYKVNKYESRGKLL